MATFYRFIDTSLGPALLTSDGRALTGFYFKGQKDYPPIGDDWVADDAAEPFARVRDQYGAYERGELVEFELPLALAGTPFQERVWHALAGVAYGERISYSELARRVGSPRAVRAVGAAVGRNPVSVIVPCHRIVGADGSLTGYAGGLDRKRWLLAHEASRQPAIWS
jgi:methylated-DNA-[protein]-cysteine S-methyltransferase